MTARDLTHHDIFRHPEHCINQIATRVLSDGTLVAAVFNEERFSDPLRLWADASFSVYGRWPGRGIGAECRAPVDDDTTGNWDCGICELDDGTLLVNLTITGFFKRGVKPGGCLLVVRSGHGAMGRLDLDLRRTKALLGIAFVVKSRDRGKTWS